jgi:hypothetical protein
VSLTGQGSWDEAQPAGLRADPEQDLCHGEGEQLGVGELWWAALPGVVAQMVVDLDVESGQEGVEVGRHKLILNTLLPCLGQPRR